jgi:hypothetical protein
MSCFHPIEAWKNIEGGKLIFGNNHKWDKYKNEKLRVPCGKCIGCLLDRASDHAVRCWCQTQTENENNCCFITLTYDNEHLPQDGYLQIKDEKDFWKRLRYYCKEAKIKYFGCGEYGPKTFRPHWHFCIWGYKPKDLEFYKYNHNGDKLYKSKELKKIWGNGFVIIGNLTYRSACYVSRYCTKKMFKKQEWNKKIEAKPECTICSKGIGLDYWEKFKNNIIENNGIHIKIDESVKNKKIPKYYMKKLKENDPMFYDWYTFERSNKAKENWDKILKNTTLTEQDYLEMQERKLLEKSEQLLKRTNFI